jgi:hypothetical protein
MSQLQAKCRTFRKNVAPLAKRRNFKQNVETLNKNFKQKLQAKNFKQKTLSKT